jgi:hypothetical protein
MVTPVPTLTEEAFRELLDERGVLRSGALAAPERDHCYAVFAQRSDARLDIEAIKGQGARFFETRLGVTVDKRYDDLIPYADAVRIVVSNGDAATSGTRLCYGRAAEAADYAAADAAERAMGTYGLALLAQRCKTIWTIVPDPPDATEDRAALTIAAIFASHLLGPIVSPGAAKIFGVRGARLELEARTSPYR